MYRRDLCCVFDALASELDASLMPSDAKQALAVLASRLAWLQSSCYLECRLGQPRTARVDFLAAITRDERDDAWRALAAAEPGRQAGLAAAARLLRAWRDQATPLSTAVPVAWLEFDDVLQQAATPGSAADVCVSLIESYRDPYAPLPAQPAAGAFELAAAAARLIRDAELDTAEHTQLETCFRSLPRQARWIHLSIMSLRIPAQLKLYGMFPRHALVPFLDDIAWQGDRRELCEVLEAYCQHDRVADEIYVDLPVRGERATDTELGLCFAQQQLRRARESDPGREKLLAQLVRDDLCTTAQAAALAAWSQPLVAAKRDRRLAIDRWLDIKLVCGRTSGVLAKAYLGFSARRAAVGLGLATCARPAVAASVAPQVHR